MGAKSWMVAGVHPTASGRIVHSFAASGNETAAQYGAILALSGDPPGNQRKPVVLYNMADREPAAHLVRRSLEQE